MPITESPALAALTSELLRALTENAAADITGATWRVSFHNPRHNGRSYSGGQLAAVAEKYRPIPPADRRAVEEAIAAAAAAYAEAGDPVRIIEYRFSRTGDGWRAEAAVETFSAYRALRVALDPAEQRVVAALATLLDDDWTETSVDRSGKADQLHILRGRERTRETPPAELTALLDEAVVVLAGHGRALTTMKIKVNGEPDMHQSDAEYSYSLIG
ncbi:hypothetical protein [Krasilnikovia sp. MM14-A1004]|uniref:hypothetical protein n=1 Tax=Krasilnikovia sp. MM14-A1004 TaxID=3373541 RepID=UPI00399D3CB9